jgi:hypothetical protein
MGLLGRLMGVDGEWGDEAIVEVVRGGIWQGWFVARTVF